MKTPTPAPALCHRHQSGDFLRRRNRQNALIGPGLQGPGEIFQTRLHSKIMLATFALGSPMDNT
jgi:hypothetical protein